jgi:hypothetical protein
LTAKVSESAEKFKCSSGDKKRTSKKRKGYSRTEDLSDQIDCLQRAFANIRGIQNLILQKLSAIEHGNRLSGQLIHEGLNSEEVSIN